MAGKTEFYNQKRRKRLIRFTVGYGIWWGMFTLTSIVPSVQHLYILNIITLGIELLGWAYWSAQLIGLIRAQKELKENVEIGLALNDEFYSYIRHKSFKFSFFVLLIVQALLLIINMFVPVIADVVLKINILIGVIVPLVSFIILEDKQQYEEGQA